MILHDEINGQDTSGMNDGIFQQIDGDLLDQHRIHGYHQKFLGDPDPDGGIGIAFFSFSKASPTTSSTGSSVVLMLKLSPWIRVTDSRFPPYSTASWNPRRYWS